jgi:hypothetical protein
MSHLDEGTLHALLDGELETHEVAEIQAHLGSCSSCGLRLREVKEFYGEADRLIASVDLQATAAAAPRPAPAPPPPAPARAEAPARRDTPRPQPVAAAPAKWEPWNEPPPVLLVPDNESGSERRMRRMRQLGWAAILLVIVGAGFIEARKFMPIAPTETPAASNASAVLSQEESPSRDASAAAAAPLAKTDSATATRQTPAPTRTLARTPAPAPPREATPARPAPQAAAGGNADELARSDAGKDSGTLGGIATGKVADSGAPNAQADSSADTDLASVRERASQALADLDRERRERAAAAATAALDARKRTARAASTVAPASAQPAAAPAPAPPTLEQRAQIYLRIGLDEASRQLGGPAHVIEGLSPVFMGLVQGGSVSGADGTRPVVRVVYQDSQGRLILLDQQRLRAGQPLPPASALSWTIGGTVMWLNGEAGADILRTYRPRVR